MRAVRVHDGEVAVDDVPAGDGPGVRVRVRSAGICGSDLHLPSTIVTHRFPLAAAVEAFSAAASRSSGAIKVILEP